MAGGMDLGNGKGPKKPLDATINLVPFIDLMAVTISFLIMTAVWTQIGRLQVSRRRGRRRSHPGEGRQDRSGHPPPLGEGPPAHGRDHAPSIPSPSPGTPSGQIDLTKLAERFKDVKEKLGPDQTAITVQTEDAVRYEDLVHVIDECIGDGFPSVSVAR